jgi:hypothetical protein
MKPILIAVALFAGTFTKSFAADNNPRVEPSVLKSFKSTFANATEVDWSTSQEFYKAVFYLNGQYITAYYNADGTMQGLSRHISAATLPVMMQTALKNDYKDQWVSDVLEVTNEDGVQYYITMEDASQRIVLKSTFATLRVFQKSRKE